MISNGVVTYINHKKTQTMYQHQWILHVLLLLIIHKILLVLLQHSEDIGKVSLFESLWFACTEPKYVSGVRVFHIPVIPTALQVTIYEGHRAYIISIGSRLAENEFKRACVCILKWRHAMHTHARMSSGTRRVVAPLIRRHNGGAAFDLSAVKTATFIQKKKGL